MTAIAGILLAAGSGRRFGGDKLMTRLPGGGPVAVAAGRALVAAIPNSLAVVRPGEPALTDRLSSIGLRILAHPGAERGIGTSVAAGVSACPDAPGWIVALGDMPWVRPETIQELLAALNRGAPLVAPNYAGTRGHPVGFSAAWRRALLSLDGDRGARDLIAAPGSGLVLLPTSDPGVVRDIDTPLDIAAPT
jgi:molybdenum cofactor cytidylyltransferase